uniref:Putative secreted protein n=1 Tax=Panstrongylus lignarius TaxID=156445 RepID=A0A224XV28_9HEMI
MMRRACFFVDILNSWYLVFSALITIRFCCAQAATFVRAPFKGISMFCGVLLDAQTITSSAKSNPFTPGVLAMASGRSLMNMLNNEQLRTAPWGKP